MTLSNHRCDWCGAQASVRLASPTGGYDVLLCSEHADCVEPVLLPSGWTIADDERDPVDTTAG